MKRTNWIKSSLVILLLVSSLPQVFGKEPIDTVRLYLQALQKGDVQRIQAFLGDPLYSKRERLLTQNAEYGNFLRKFYEGAEFGIEENSSSENNDEGQLTRSVKIVIEFSDGNRSVITLQLSKDSEGVWKIVGEN